MGFALRDVQSTSGEQLRKRSNGNRPPETLRCPRPNFFTAATPCRPRDQNETGLEFSDARFPDSKGVL